MASSPETVLVTGASSGIGRALAHRFARAGSRCVLLARSEDALHALADTLQSDYEVDAHVLPADLSVDDAAERIERELRKRDLSVDVLVNNAGFGARGAFAGSDPRRQLDMVRVNVLALTALTRRLLPGMVDRGRGGVLNVASTAAFQPGPQMSVYYATKAYVLSFSEGLTEEVAGDDVTVTCLAPGPTDTAFIDEAEMDETALFAWAVPMTPEAVAAAGYDGFRAGSAVVVPGLANKIGAVLIRFTPRSVARKVAAWLNT
jgi:hypothetical protein